MRKALILLAGITAMLLGLAACEPTGPGPNANVNVNANTRVAEATPTATPKYTEEQAREARARAKENKETVGDTLDDAWIHTKIVAKLIANSRTPERKINVDVVNNAVTLRGTVDTPEGKTEAERIAKDTEGVTKVTNQLKVVAAKPPAKTK
ncbi:MAG: BON domain-containing protein [Acidobacteriota bacterium]